MKNTRLSVNRNFRIRICQMRRGVRRMRQIQHQHQVSLYESFRRADLLQDRFLKMWEFPGA